VQDTSTRSRLWRQLEPVVRLLSATILVGAGAGAVIGGVGGRIAMRVLFLTSDDAVKGVTSDDGFEIGRFTLGDTLGLIVVTAFIGVLAALLFLVARPFVERLGRAAIPATALLYGVLGGAMMVHRDGIDFQVLEPVALAIVLFVAICGGFGAVVAALVIRAARTDAWPHRTSWWVLAPPLVLVLFPPFAAVALAAVAINWPATANGRATWVWKGVEAGAFAVMAALLVVGAVDLARDTAALV
jgi:hypothetical protein